MATLSAASSTRVVRRKAAMLLGLIVSGLLFAGACAAADIEHFACRHLSGGTVPRSITLTLNYAAKTIETAPDGWFTPMPESVEIKEATANWSFMRGYAVFDRRTHKLDWDATAEYDYLDTIGHMPKEARDTFQGRMQCMSTAGR